MFNVQVQRMPCAAQCFVFRSEMSAARTEVIPDMDMLPNTRMAHGAGWEG